MLPRTLKVISLLLDYPEQELLDHLDELQAATEVDKGMAPRRLAPFYQHLRQGDVYLFQENYVALFDRGRGTSLYLFEHVHGESRDRGQAMVDLLTMYGESGYELPPGELPDYLPVFLEYLSQLDTIKAKTLLAEVTHLIRNIGDNLAKRGSHYYLLCSALLEMAGEVAIDVDFVARDFSTEQEDYDKIEKAWAEEPVTFGGGAPLPESAVVNFVPRAKHAAARSPGHTPHSPH